AGSIPQPDSHPAMPDARSNQRAGGPASGSGRPHRAALGFILRFAAGWAGVLLLTAFVPGIERGAVTATVGCVSWLLHLASVQATVDGGQVLVSAGAVQISPECTPLFPTAVLWTAILAFPATLRWRIAGAVAGAAALWVYNLARGGRKRQYGRPQYG